MNSYKLADGTLVGEAKVGDKFITNEDYKSFKKGDVVTLVEQDGTECPQFSGLRGSHYCFWHRLVGFQPKQFTKSDLKDGMKIVLRNGKTNYVLGINLLDYAPHLYAGNGGYTQASHLNCYGSDLRHVGGHFQCLDIMEVYERDGTLLWKREEKSQTEIELEKLQSQISELQEQANKLKATIK